MMARMNSYYIGSLTVDKLLAVPDEVADIPGTVFAGLVARATDWLEWSEAVVGEDAGWVVVFREQRAVPLESRGNGKEVDAAPARKLAR